MNNRNLLYVIPKDAEIRLPEAIPAAGWSVHATTDTAQAAEWVARDDFRVGLCLLEPYREAQVRQWSTTLFADSPHMEWVGMLSPDRLEHREVCTLILECFYDFHTLPPDPERLLVTLGHAHGMAEVAHNALHVGAHCGGGGEYEMVGSSPVMLELFRTIRKVAAVDAPVLITGESGTGKELTAQAIHERSPYAQGKFIAVNCGALPASLIQSELFGHEKGSFTGAHERKIGRIEAADGGTLFLDEIGDLPLDLQVNLLRFLQETTIQRIGGREEIAVNARVIAATHVDLEKAVREGRFREDLYYRLNVLHAEMPPLRAREGDIELLARFFFHKFSKDKRANVKGFSQQALEVMQRHAWPGNVRELINRIRRALVMSENRLITPGDLGLERRKCQRRLMTLEAARAHAEKRAVEEMLRHTRRNVSQAAKALGVTRATLYRLMDKHHIKP